MTERLVTKDGLLDMAGAAKYLGISYRSMERLLERDEVIKVNLPGMRKNLFRPEDLDLLIKESRIVPASVPAQRHIRAVNGGKGRN